MSSPHKGRRRNTKRSQLSSEVQVQERTEEHERHAERDRQRVRHDAPQRGRRLALGRHVRADAAVCAERRSRQQDLRRIRWMDGRRRYTPVSTRPKSWRGARTHLRLASRRVDEDSSAPVRRDLFAGEDVDEDLIGRVPRIGDVPRDARARPVADVREEREERRLRHRQRRLGHGVQPRLRGAHVALGRFG